MGDNSISTVLGAASAVQTFVDLQGAGNVNLVDTYTGSLALKDSMLSDAHTVASKLQSVASSGKGGLPDSLNKALQTALATTLKDTTKTGVGSVGLGFSLQNGLTDFLSAGETITVVYNVSVSDGHGRSVTQPVSFLISGTNGAPVISSADVIGDDDALASNQTHNDWGWGQGVVAVQGDVYFTDANVDDTHTASASLVAAIPSTGSVSAALLSALSTALKTHLSSDQGGKVNDVNWGFIAPAALSSLAPGQSLLVEYVINVADNHGGVTSQPVTILLTSGSGAGANTGDGDGDTSHPNQDDGGSTQAIFVSGVTSAQIAEVSGAAPTSLDTASGVIGLVGGDVNATTGVSSKLAFVNWSGGAAIPTASLAALNAALTLALTQTGGTDQSSGNDANATGDKNSGGTQKGQGDQNGRGDLNGQGGQHGEGDNEEGATTVTWSFSAADSVFKFLSAGQTLTLAYEVTGKDAQGETVTRLVTVTIIGTNHGPILAADPASHAITDMVGGAGSTTPDTLLATLNFTSSSLTDTHTVSLSAPTITSTATSAIPAATLAALASALSETLTDSVGTGTGSVALSFSAADGLFHFLSAGEILKVVYNVTVADSHGNTSTQPVTFTITGVDDAPVVAVDTGLHAFTDVTGGAGSATPDTLAANLTFTDPNLDDTHKVTIAAPTATWSAGTAIPASAQTALASALTATLTDSTHTGTGSVALAFSAADGVFHFLSAGETLTLTYNVTVTDSAGLYATQPVTITVTGTNDAPVLAVDTTTHAFSDVVGGAGSTTPDTSSATLTFTDVNLDDTHTVSIGAPTANWSGGTTIPTATLTALNSALTSTLTDSTHTGAGSVALAFSAADGLFHFLSQGETLTVTYNVTVTDSHGATSTQPVTFTITGVDDAPTITAAVAEQVNENAVLTVSAATLLATATDPNLNNALTLTSVGAAQNGTVSLVNGVVTFTPTAYYYGPASYTYTVTDSHGQSVMATANVTVNQIAVPPTIPVPATGTVNENTPLTVTAAALVATANDTNPNESLSLTSVGTALNGTVSLVGGVVTFTPTTGFYGTATYQYTVTDNYGLSATATSTVTVNPVSAPPTLTLVNTTGAENTAIPVSIATAVTDPADHLTSLVVSAIPVGVTLSDGAGHTFTATAGATQVNIAGWTLTQLTLTPPTNFIGTIPLTVTSSSQLATATPAATVGTVDVTSVLDHPAPVAVTDSVLVNEGTAKTINVLFNDIETAGLPLSISSVTSAAHGNVVINANNTITYIPTAGYLGADSFTYTESDGRGGVSTATVNLNIRPPSVATAPLVAVGSNSIIIPTDGSALKTVLSLHAGDVVSFNWNFSTTDYSPYKDFAFATVNGTAFMLADIQSVGDSGTSGTHTFSYTVTADGTYTFGAGVMNDQDQNFNSYLEVDNLAVNGATVQNFANGLTGLNGVTSTSLGAVTEVTQGVAGATTLTPANGTNEAFLTSGPAMETNVESFLGLAQNQLQNIAASLGNEYTPVVLPILVTAPTNNPDDTYVTISGAPVGTVFNHGVYNSTTNTWKIEASDLGGNLTFVTPSNYSGSFYLTVTATSVIYGTNSTATTPIQQQLVTVQPAAVTVDGSAGGQVVVGGTVAGNTLIGGPGDTLTGGSTNDTFVFNGTTFGKNTVTDFSTTTDVLQFSHTAFADAATALSHASQVGSDVVITFDANDTVTLKNVLLATLHASDFHII